MLARCANYRSAWRSCTSCGGRGLEIAQPSRALVEYQTVYGCMKRLNARPLGRESESALDLARDWRGSSGFKPNSGVLDASEHRLAAESPGYLQGQPDESFRE